MSMPGLLGAYQLVGAAATALRGPFLTGKRVARYLTFSAAAALAYPHSPAFVVFTALQNYPVTKFLTGQVT